MLEQIHPDFIPNPSLTLRYLVGLSMSFRVTSCHSYSSFLLHKELQMPAGCKARVKTIRINSLTISDSFVRQIAQTVKFQCIFQLPSGQVQKFYVSKSYCTLPSSKQVVGLSRDHVTVQINQKYSHHRGRLMMI